MKKKIKTKFNGEINKKDLVKRDFFLCLALENSFLLWILEFILDKKQRFVCFAV